MQNLKEDLVSDLFRTGAIKAFSLEIREGQALIHYKMLDGTPGCIHTKRGQPKEYRIETALRFLRSLGVAGVTVDMAAWSVGQKGLL